MTFPSPSPALAVERAVIATKPVVSRARPVATSLALLAADVIAILASRWLAVYCWSRVNLSIGLSNYFDFWPSLGLFVLMYAAFGLYAGGGLSPVEELRRTVLATILVALFVTAAVFFLKDEGPYSRGLLAASGLLTALLAPSARALLRRLFAAQPWWGIPVVVLGAGKTARLLVKSLEKWPGAGLKPVACLDDDPAKQGLCASVPVAGSLSLAPEIAQSLKIRHALVAMPGVDRRQLVRIVERWGAAFPHLIVIPDLFGMASLWVSPKDIGGTLGLELRQNLLIPANRWIKRALDLAGASLLGLLALPILAAAALWIKIVSPGPAFYRQEREGEAGRSIWIPKLRTMYPDAEVLLVRVLSHSPQAQAEWRQFFKLRRDPRILPGIGRILRQTSLDELPQLWSILTGEMSLVGPRPFPRYHVEQFDAEFRALRNRVKPGLTGLWQVSDRSDGDLKTQQALDAYYIRNWSLWLDLYILARTVRAVLFPKGAY